jgi:small subunit ribosomal protein S20
MANNKSAKKRVLQHERNRQRNRDARTLLRSSVKRFRSAVEAGDAGTAAYHHTAAPPTLDRTASRGIIHAKTASRYKSRLALAQLRMVAEATS